MNPYEHRQSGGAQFNDYRMIRFGERERGTTIDVVTPHFFAATDFEEFDLLILSNIVSFDKTALSQILKTKPYVTFNHDFNFCNFRLYNPARATCKDCPGVKWWKKTFERSQLNIFLSPLHRKAHEIVFEKSLGRECWIPSNLDVDKFVADESVKRVPGTVVGINCLEAFKGRYEVHKYVEAHPELQFTFAGQSPSINQPNCSYVPFVKPKDMPGFLSKFEYGINLPSNVDPFCRVAAEMLLCGLKSIHNDNVGFFSYPWNYSSQVEVRNYLRQSGAGFWDEVYAAAKKLGIK